MKKKRQKPSTTVAAAAAIVGDLESIIHSHSVFFDHLIELIPARFYLTNDDESKPWYQGLSKAAKASLKQQSKKNLKLARRNRFDPDNDPSTLHILQQQQISKAPLSEEGNEDGEPGAKPIDLEENEEISVTYEELLEKLHRKMQLLRGNRGEKKTDERKAKNDRNKRKRGGENDSGGKSGKEVRSEDDDDDEGEEIIEYGKVKLGDEDDGKQGKKKKRKLSKAKELEKAKKTQEVKKDNPFFAKRESWKAATSRAMGEKVHDDPRLIKESMKKEKRKKVKNAEKWKERVETQEKMKEERQRKRKENIDGRINDKKMRKIAKREKKLMRPGFEGRKEGFITDD